MRRRRRLGALLFQLHYYAVSDRRDAEGQIVLYCLDSSHYVEVMGRTVRIVAGQAGEDMDLETAIARCKQAVAGRSLHIPAEGEAGTEGTQR